MRIHIVKKGETLYLIAKKYNVDLDELIALNPIIANPDDLVVGLKVKLPPSHKLPEPPAGGYVHKHIVVQGDTLWKLSKAWGVPLKAVIDANPHLKNPNILMTGDVVFIPKMVTEEPHTDQHVVVEGMPVPGAGEALTLPEQVEMPGMPGMPETGVPMTEMPVMPETGTPLMEIPGMPHTGGPMTEIPGMPQTGAPMMEMPGMPHTGGPVTGMPGMPQMGGPTTEMPGMPHTGGPMTGMPGMPHTGGPMTGMPGMPQMVPGWEPGQAPQYPMYAMPHGVPAMPPSFGAAEGLQHPFAQEQVPSAMVQAEGEPGGHTTPIDVETHVQINVQEFGFGMPHPVSAEYPGLSGVMSMSADMMPGDCGCGGSKAAMQLPYAMPEWPMSAPWAHHAQLMSAMPPWAAQAGAWGGHPAPWIQQQAPSFMPPSIASPYAGSQFPSAPYGSMSMTHGWPYSDVPAVPAMAPYASADSMPVWDFGAPGYDSTHEQATPHMNVPDSEEEDGSSTVQIRQAGAGGAKSKRNKSNSRSGSSIESFLARQRKRRNRIVERPSIPWMNQ